MRINNSSLGDRGYNQWDSKDVTNEKNPALEIRFFRGEFFQGLSLVISFTSLILLQPIAPGRG